MNSQNSLFWGSILAALAVALGAFGAHGLKNFIPPDQLQIFETGIRYHFYHSFALLITGLVLHWYPNKWVSRAAVCFMVGILFFSGSLYLLANRVPLNIEGWWWLGPITPIGGIFFIIGWLLFSIGVAQQNQKS